MTVTDLVTRIRSWVASLSIRDVLLSPVWLVGALAGTLVAVLLRILAALAIGFRDGAGEVRLPSGDTIRGIVGLAVIAGIVVAVVA